MSTENHTEKQAEENILPQLLQEFPPSTYEDWKEAAIKLLKGAPFEKQLFRTTYEGLTLQPIYMREDLEKCSHCGALPGFPPYVRGNHTLGHKATSWDMVQEIHCQTPAALNAALKQAFQQGQPALYAQLDHAACQGKDPNQAQPEDVGHNGVSLATIEDIERIFENIAFEKTPVFIQSGAAAFPVAALFAAFAQIRQIALAGVHGCIGFDPLGVLVSEGRLPFSLETAYTMLASLTHWAHTNTPHLKTILVQGTPYHESGGNAVQEIAFSVATAVEYLRQMLQHGLSLNEVTSHIQFAFSLGTNLFTEIAKLRSARLVWAKIISVFGGDAEAQKMRIHAGTSLWNKTAYDPYVNMLRTTVEAFAGVIGGCDSLHVGCFDEILRTPDEFSQRIARNTHLILQEEAHLQEVVDPAGGSWYAEKLTDDLARESWTLFQELERQGGMTEALTFGFPQEQIANTASQRFANMSTRNDVMVGTNMYSNVKEVPLEVRRRDNDAIYRERLQDLQNYRQRSSLSPALPSEINMDACIQAALRGATLGDIASALFIEKENTPHIQPIRIQRKADMFEVLRAATQRYIARVGSPPQIFLAKMGPSALHRARADFSSRFFEVGGFETLPGPGFQTVDEAVEATIRSQAPIVVICSIDETYPEIVPPLTRKLKASNPEIIVILAGYPHEHIETFKQAGVDEFIHLRANIYEVLKRVMTALKIIEEEGSNHDADT